LPWLVVGVGELAVAERGDAAAGVAVAAGSAGVLLADGGVAPVAGQARHGLRVPIPSPKPVTKPDRGGAGAGDLG